jgi:HK97 family phage major capsid protein
LALGRHFDPHRVVIPFSMLSAQRDLTVASASAAGYLVGEEQARVVDVLRGWSIAADGGVQVIPMEHGSLTVPRNIGNSTTTWLATEASGTTEVGPVVGEVALSGKTVAVYTKFSHLLSKVAPQLELFLRLHLLGSVGQAIDTAVFGGTGASGQPLGILNTAGVGVVSGSSLGWPSLPVRAKTA